MSGFFSPNFAVLSSWQSALTVAFQQLRRVRFVVENTFEFQTFDPQVDWQGMTASAVDVNRARYILIGKVLFFSIDIRATLAAPFASKVRVVLPLGLTAKGDAVQGAGAFIGNAGGFETGTWSAIEDQGYIEFLRSTGAAFTAGAFFAIANGFIEVK